MRDCNTTQAKSVVLEKETTMTPEQIAAQSLDYRGIVGSLTYLVRGTRPDIANALRELSKYLSCYNKTHWRAAQRMQLKEGKPSQDMWQYLLEHASHGKVLSKTVVLVSTQQNKS
jgi:hypothetical protein